jgi:hypothetical protein
VGKINEALARIDSTIEEASQPIDLLREDCASLISAAVTGKIDICKEIG